MNDERPKGMSIGAVAQLTGIAPDTLRTWERRYEVVEPLRDAAERRVYTDAHVQRLSAVAELVGRGERIADVARLSDAELAERLRLHGHLRGVQRVRVALWPGDARPALWGHDPALGVALEPGDGLADVVLADVEALGEPAEAALDAWLAESGASRAVLTYAFLPRALRRRLDRPDVRLVHRPLSSDALRREVLEHVLAHRSEPAPTASTPARFTRGELQRLIDAAPSLPCECPNHLASLVMQLRAFEAYSRSCVDRTPEAAALHRAFAEGAGRAAASMEELLGRAMAHEGLLLP